ncbi:hypothetical protein ACFPYI_18815 [Halomarina salina]|uniref:Sodium/phosphate symporter n=1 Tax=Halomarina salina TaxID=1872699 RepID=A0ABD5RS74_9EURY|nr:hypothetical protein [Halomarina salina]
MSPRRRLDLVLVLAVIAVGVATRLLPLHFSPLPFNTDAFVFVRYSELILQNNHLAFSGPAAPYPDEYLFDMLLAMVSEVVGMSPLYLVQILIACLAIVPSLVAVAYARSLTADLPRAHRRGAMALAGIGLSVEGLYLWRTATISSEVYGLSFIACIVLSLHRGLQTGSRRWLALTAILSALMPIVHNGSTFVVGLIGTVLTALAVGRQFTIRRALGGTIGVVGFWALAFGYYEVVELPNAATISAAPGLFIAWTILIVGVARWLDRTSPRVQRGVPVTVFSLGVLVFTFNAFVPVFPGMPTTSIWLLIYTVPLVTLLVVAAVGIPWVTTKQSQGIAMVAVVIAPLAAIGFALTGGRTPEYQALLTRSTTFMHLGVVVIAAVALAILAHRRPTLGRMATVIVVIAILISAPFPFAGLGTIPFEAVTEPTEFETVMFATEHMNGTWASDDHFTHIGTKYRGANVVDTPTSAWLRGDASQPACPTIGREIWTTRGAPAVPKPLSLSTAAYEQWVMTGDIIYNGGGSESTVVRWVNGQCEQSVLSEGTR